MRNSTFRDMRSAPKDGTPIEVRHGSEQEIVRAEWSGQAQAWILVDDPNRKRCMELRVGDLAERIGRQVLDKLMSDGLLAPRRYLNVHTVHSICTRCDRWVKLDLAALVAAGHGDTPLVRLPLRCSQCSKMGHEIKVSGQSYGLGAGPGGQ